MKKIRKAVIPGAGYGTRFLPATKAMPKEMLPIIDKPTIQYVVEELVGAGIEQIILVTGWHKRAIEDHFDRHFELETKLTQSGKIKQRTEIVNISNMAEFVYVRQKEMRGNGDAILTAANIVGDEPFVVCWGDDFIKASPSRTTQLINAYNTYGGVILGAINSTAPDEANKYAFAKGETVAPGVIHVSQLIEKPGPTKKPSNLGIVSGCILPPTIFSALKEAEKSIKPGEELVYVDGINILKENGENVHAIEVQNGKYYDCGNVFQYLKTNIELGLERNDIGNDLKEYLKNIVNGL